MSRSQAGFTLLELLLVLFILSILAGVAVVAVDGVDNQERRQGSLRTLELMRRGILGDPELLQGRTPALSGFVVDYGRLPIDATELADGMRGMASPLLSAPMNPRYSTTATDGKAATASSPEITTLPEEARLLKGFRGPYGVGTDPGDIQDGWGNEVAWAGTAPILELQSLGRNGVVDATPPVETEDADFIETIQPADWQVNLLGLQVEVRLERTGFTIPTGARVVLMSFEHDPADDDDMLPQPHLHWKHHRSVASTIILVRNTGQDAVSETLSFSNGLVPMGEHLLLLARSDGTLIAGSDGKAVYARLRLHSRTSLPADVKLIVR